MASHDQVSRLRCRIQRRQTLRPIPASHGPNRSGCRSRSRLSRACSDASWAASSASASSPSARRQTPSSNGRWRVSKAPKAPLSPPRAASTSCVSACSTSVARAASSPHSIVANWALMVTFDLAGLTLIGEGRVATPSTPSLPYRESDLAAVRHFRAMDSFRPERRPNKQYDDPDD